jgi:hypothetical protein
MIEELRTLEEKATPGPWGAVPMVPTATNYFYLVGNRDGNNAEKEIGTIGPSLAPSTEANAALIVALVNNLPAILSALTAASKLEVAKKALRKSQQGWENVVEMGILPPRHWETANNLSNDCLQALAALEAK